MGSSVLGDKIDIYKIRFLVFIVSLIAFIGCGQESDIQQLEIELVSTEMQISIKERSSEG